MTKSCDDEKPCTADSCDPDNGDCLHDATTGPCDDGDPCTTDDFCQEGQCQTGLGELDCDDHNDCTNDDCVALQGCVNTPQAGPCNDQDDCTSGETCQDGLCTGGANACACNTSDDCWPQNDADWCNGMLYCNTDKTPKVCEVDPTTIIKCSPAQDSYCQAKTCDPLDGVCKFKARNEGQPCDNPCTNSPTCQNGQCKGTACTTLNMACAGGVCISNNCTANSKTCDGSFAYLTCNGTGNGWSSSTPCGPGKYCEAGDCKPQVCTPNQLSCVARFAGTCNPKGSALLPGYTDCQTLPETQYCAAGLCTTCAPNCAGKDCGDDGCGGSCGTCEDGLICEAKGTCCKKNPQGYCTYPGTGGVTWVALPGGSFMMGCSPGDTECQTDKYPLHQVILSPFMILETEVTEGQYLAVMGINPSNPKRGANYPVDTVSWYNAHAMCQSIGARLPTEAEWEYAARAGSDTKYSCGNDPSCLTTTQWCSGSTDNKRQVATKNANAFGLFDMLGNVAELAGDWYASGYYTVSEVVDPHGPSDSNTRACRGGHTKSPSYTCRVSNRQGILQGPQNGDIGFRCAR
jgi:formylglycine-generating enzyme required for sulfatase activity